MIGYIILSLTLAAFISIGIWILVKMFKLPKLPSGYKFEAIHSKNKAIVIIDKNIEKYSNEDFIVNEQKYNIKELMDYSAKSITATEVGFINKKIKTDIKEIVFVFQPDYVFERDAPLGASWAKNVGAYTTKQKTMFNIKQIYIVFIKSKFIKNIFENGYPLIHENIHILNKEAGLGYNKPHDDQKLWARHGKNTVEAIATDYWKNLLGK